MPEGTRLNDPRRPGEDQPVQPLSPRLERTLRLDERGLPVCEMPPEKFRDYFRYFNNNLDAHRSAVWTLYDEIRALKDGDYVLSPNAAWVERWNEKPPEPQWPVMFDPSGSEEAGMIGPKKKAPMMANDSYLLVNDRDGDMEAFDAYGKFLWKIPCLARGQGSDYDYKNTNTDTPPGLYKLGTVYRDYENYGANPSHDGTLQSYGWYSFDMEEQEGQEAAYGRAGIMCHGGGSACGWPGAWNQRQTLYPTMGCLRCYNIDLRDKILPLYEKGTVWVGVWQEKG